MPFPLAAVLPDVAAALLPFVGDVPVAGAVQKQRCWCSAGRSPPRRLQVDAERLGHALEDVPAPAAHAAHRPDERDRPVEEAQRRVGNQQIGIEGEAVAEAVAVGTHALRTVEAEELRAGRLVALVAVRAGVVGREQDVLIVVRLRRWLPSACRTLDSLALLDSSCLDRDDQRALAQRQCLLDRLGQPRPDFGVASSAGR